MLLRTKNYEIFKFREDNREKILDKDVDILADSLRKDSTMLDIKPVIVNKDMEIMDGQHRVLACQKLGIDVVYIKKELTPEQMKLLNTATQWKNADHLNYYIQHGYEQYIKLKKFMDKHNLTLRIALGLMTHGNQTNTKKFRDGDFIFDDKYDNANFSLIHETNTLIREYHGVSPWTENMRYWKALCHLFTNEKFNKTRWINNVKKMTSRLSIKPTFREYCEMIQTIYNYHSREHIYILNEKSDV